MAARCVPAWTATLLPANATPWETAIEGAESGLVAADPVDLIASARDPAACPPGLLPYLAMERSVVAYDTGWPLAQRRAVVAGSFAQHRAMGTRQGLNLALAHLGYTLTVREWFEATPKLDPYLFTISVGLDASTPWTAEAWAAVVSVANRAKNARSLLASIAPLRTVPGGPCAGGYVTRRRAIAVSPAPPIIETLLARPFVFVGGVLKRAHTLAVSPLSI